MATALGQRRTAPAHADGARLRPPQARQRQVPWVVIGVLLIVGGALLGGVWAKAVSHRQAVLAVARPVPAGQAIAEADVKVVHVGGDAGVPAIAADRADTVLGQSAAVDLVPDTLLIRRHVGSDAGLSPGKAIVGLALKPGQIPTAKLSPGSQVDVVDTGAAPGAVTTARPTVLATARVAGVEEAESDAGGKTVVVSLAVDRASAPAIGAAGASGRAILVLAS